MTLEHLEPRRFLSVTVDMQYNGDLHIEGTGNDNHIVIEMRRSSISGSALAIVTSNGKPIWQLAEGNNAMIPFPERFVLFGRGGDDRLVAHEVDDSDLRVIIRGGSGDDRITLDSDNGFPARVYGNRGNDTIIITGRRTTADGGHHSQWGHLVNVHGNAGDDRIEHHARYDDDDAAEGYARLFGDAGDDLIIGGERFDRLQGGAAMTLCAAKAAATCSSAALATTTSWAAPVTTSFTTALRHGRCACSGEFSVRYWNSLGARSLR